MFVAFVVPFWCIFVALLVPFLHLFSGQMLFFFFRILFAFFAFQGILW